MMIDLLTVLPIAVLTALVCIIALFRAERGRHRSRAEGAARGGGHPAALATPPVKAHRARRTWVCVGGLLAVQGRPGRVGGRGPMPGFEEWRCRASSARTVPE
ncbi:hypothetical protein [Streptomyces solincola]|uniref:hypothetical protein n=1 Tax=Streptomyces solincola TaxID=2100817 RepID=UPI0015E27374|nr:hypothetical protein [Streptomyces solincola]